MHVYVYREREREHEYVCWRHTWRRAPSIANSFDKTNHRSSNGPLLLLWFELRRLVEFGRLLECRYNLHSPLHIYAQMLRLISLGTAIECRDDETRPDYRPFCMDSLGLDWLRIKQCKCRFLVSMLLLGACVLSGIYMIYVDNASRKSNHF